MLEVCVHVVLQRRLLRVWHVLRELVAGMQVDVSVAQVLAMGLQFD